MVFYALQTDRGRQRQRRQRQTETEETETDRQTDRRRQTDRDRQAVTNLVFYALQTDRGRQTDRQAGSSKGLPSLFIRPATKQQRLFGRRSQHFGTTDIDTECR